MRKCILSFFFIVFIFSVAQTVSAQTYYITTIAGNGGVGYNGDGIAATSAELNNPIHTATDKLGNVYIADGYNHRVRMINASGVISTFAGNGISGYNGDGGQATDAELDWPIGLAFDDAGNLYIDDLENVIRKVAPNGIITTFAGDGIGGFAGDGGQATDAEIDLDRGVAVDKSGNVYIADQVNNRIREVNKQGIITTVAGNGTSGYSGDGGPATDAEMTNTSNVGVDYSGNIYIDDLRNNVIRKVNTKGIISTFAGNGAPGYSGDGGPATDAEINTPEGVVADKTGNVYITDVYSERVRRVDTNGIITTIAGTGVAGHTGDGGLALSAELNSAIGINLDTLGNIYISENVSGNNDIRKLYFCPLTFTLNPPAPPPICKGQSVSLTASGGSSYQWSPSAGLNITSGDSVIATPAASITYTVTAADSLGCSGTKSVVVVVQTAPPLIVQPQSPSVCSGQSIVLSVPVSGSNYMWSPAPTLSSSTADTVVATPVATTIYSITGNDSLGCVVTGTDTISFINAPPLIIQPLSPIVCPGQSVTLRVPVSGSDYLWNPSASLSETQGNIVVATPSVTTTYTVTGTDSLNCSVSASDTVYVSNAPNKPTITPRGTLLTSSATQGNQWVRNDTALQGATNQTYSVIIAGWYEVIAENPANGCSTTSDSVYINPSGINPLTVESGQLTVYPNPTDGEINVNISSSVGGLKDWNLQITDVLGRTVYTKLSLGYNNDIDLSTLSGGVYFVCVMNKTSRAVMPVVKQ